MMIRIVTMIATARNRTTITTIRMIAIASADDEYDDTVTVNVVLVEPPLPSLAVTLMTLLPMSVLVGLPPKVQDVLVKTSHLGSALPLF